MCNSALPWGTRVGADPAFRRAAQVWPAALLALRPGGYHVFTLLGKLVQGRPLYRYNTAEVRPSGFTPDTCSDALDHADIARRTS